VFANFARLVVGGQTRRSAPTDRKYTVCFLYSASFFFKKIEQVDINFKNDLEVKEAPSNLAKTVTFSPDV
jgi:hypothetical protein